MNSETNNEESLTDTVSALAEENESLKKEVKRYQYRCTIQSDLIDELNKERASLDKEYKNLENNISFMEPAWRKWEKLKGLFPVRCLRFARHLPSNLKKRNKAKAKEKIVPITLNTSENPTVSIIIPVYNQFNYTYGCLKSIMKFTDVPYEVIIGDDVSNDKTVHLDKYVQGIKIVRNSENLKFLLNCNNAAKQAKGKYILFLNNDTKVTEGWLSSLVNLIESDDSIGMVGSKLVYPDGKLQEAGGIIFQDGSGWNYGRNQDPSMSEYNYVKDVDYISGAAIMIRHDLWDKIGGFDETFAPAYYEDTDLAFQVRQQGYRVVYQPKSVVVHFEGVSNGTDTSTGLKQYQVVNAKRFKEKWDKVLKESHSAGPEDLFVARERSQKRKIVVFVDHYVPQFDQDAGSKSTLSYIKAFLDLGYSVKFIGDNFYQDEPYTTALQQMGVEVLYGYWYYMNWQNWAEENGKYFDVVFMNRPHITIKYIDFFKRHSNAKLIYYGHDLHYIRERREYEITGDEETLKDSEKKKIQEYSIMYQADVVYYPSYIETDIIREEDPSIHTQAIPVYVYEEPFAGEKLPVSQRKDIVFVGGFAHNPNADAVLWFVNEIFPYILSKIPDIKFYIVGSKPTQEILALASDNIIVKGFVSDEELVEIYKNCRIDVVPLRYGAGMKGKVIEGIYNQIPLITTNIGAEGLRNWDGVIAVEDDAQAFAEKVVELYNDEGQLNDMINASAKYIQDYFSMDAAIEILKRDL